MAQRLKRALSSTYEELYLYKKLREFNDLEPKQTLPLTYSTVKAELVAHVETVGADGIKKLVTLYFRYCEDVFHHRNYMNNIVGYYKRREKGYWTVVEQHLTLNGKKVFLFSKTGSSCVAHGTIQFYNDEKWGRLGMKTQKLQRVVVKLETVEVPGAMNLYPVLGASTCVSLGDCGVGTLILWDSVNLPIETDAAVQWLQEAEKLVPLQQDAETLQAAQLTSPSDEDGFFAGVVGMGSGVARIVSSIDDVVDFDGHLGVFRDGKWESMDTAAFDDGEDEEEARRFTFAWMFSMQFNKSQRHYFRIMEHFDFYGTSKSDNGFTDSQIAEWKNKNWAFVLKYCRRAVPSKCPA
ncbi:UNVERIFIED_CONTAM: hypothetical protein HDU68_009935 [Siphonaria sp. JEL0065]|nr:hypothetical protein HDU68_009935 [Siphonaria sp. JEL0065]